MRLSSITKFIFIQGSFILNYIIEVSIWRIREFAKNRMF